MKSSSPASVAALTERCTLAGWPSYDSCGWTYHPRATISSVSVNGSHESSVASATSVDSGGTTTRSAGTASTAATIRSTASKTCVGQPEVALVADRGHHRPRAGDRPAGAGGLGRLVEHRVARPRGRGEELRPAQRGVAVQQQRGALGGVGVLVGVDADRRDALDRERPRRHRRGPAGRRTAAPSRRCRRRRGSARRRRGAAAAISVTGSTTPWAYDGALATTSTVRSSIAAAIAAASARKSAPTGHQHRLDAEVVRGLVERRVRGGGQHHGRAARRRAGSRARPARPAGSTRCPPDVTVPTAPSGASSRPAGEPDELVLHPEQAGEGGRVEGVGAGVRRHGLAADPVHLGVAAVVHVGQRAAAVDGQVARLQRTQPVEGVHVSGLMSWPPWSRGRRRPRRACSGAARAG